MHFYYGVWQGVYNTALFDCNILIPHWSTDLPDNLKRKYREHKWSIIYRYIKENREHKWSIILYIHTHIYYQVCKLKAYSFC